MKLPVEEKEKVTSRKNLKMVGRNTGYRGSKGERH